MSILKDLLSLKQEKTVQVQEARRKPGDLHDALEQWMENNRAYTWEGTRGVKNLAKLVGELNHDYRDIDMFLEDNPGAQQAILEWIMSANVPEWLENLSQGDDGDDE